MKHGQVTITTLIMGFITIIFAIILIANVLPPFIEMADNSSLDATSKTIIDFFPAILLLIIVGSIMLYIMARRDQQGGY